MAKDRAIRTKAEKMLGTLGKKCYTAPFYPVVICLALLLFSFYQCFSLRFEYSMEGYLHEDELVLKQYTDFQNRFGSDIVAIIGIVSEDVLSGKFLRKLEGFQKSLEQDVPHITHIASLLNAPRIQGNASELSVGTLQDILPHFPGQEKRFRETVNNSNLYENRYFSSDRKLALVSLSLRCPELEQSTDDVLDQLTGNGTSHQAFKETKICRLSNQQNKALIRAVQKVLSDHQSDDFEAHLTGTPALREFFNTVMKADLKKFLVISFLLMLLILFVLFRNSAGVLAPVVIVCCTLLSTLGLISFFDVPFQAPTRIIPTFLMSVSISTTVHILVMFFQFRESEESEVAAIERAMEHSGIPVILTSVTTASGLASFGTAAIVPVQNLGLCAAAGVMFSLFYTLFLLPALLALFPVGKKGKDGLPTFSLFGTMISRLSTFTVAHAKWIGAVFLAFFVISIIAMQSVRFVHDPMLRLPETTQLRQSTELISSHFPGLARIELTVDTGKEDGLLSEESARSFFSFSDQLYGYSGQDLAVHSVTSIYDLLWEFNQELIRNPDHLDTLSNELLAQEMFLIENSVPHIYHSYVDGGNRIARISVSLPWTDALAYQPLFDYISSSAHEHFAKMKEVVFTGTVPLLTRTVSAAIESMVKSYTIAILVISAVMIILIGQFHLGLISMIPNLLPICFTIGFMGIAGIPMDIYALLIGSIALGLVVDDTIHFMHNFRKYYSQTKDVEESVRLTLSTSGMAMLMTTITLTCGAFVFMCSEMKNIQYFGLLTGTAVVLALVADFLLAPALMALYYNKKTK